MSAPSTRPSTISEVLERSETPEYKARTGWTSVFFDSNAKSGLVEGPDDLVRFAKAWMGVSEGRTLDEFLGALEAPVPEGTHRLLKFGFRAECTGPRTLRDHLTANGLDLDWLKRAIEGP